MNNTLSQLGALISRASKELQQSNRERSVTKMLVSNGVVNSDSELSWIHKGQRKHWDLYILTFKEVISHLEPKRRLYYLEQLLDIEAQKAIEENIKQ